MKNESMDLSGKVKAFYNPKIRKNRVLIGIWVPLFFILQAFTEKYCHSISGYAFATGAIVLVILVLIEIKNTGERHDLIFNWSGEDTLFWLNNWNASHGSRKSYKQLLEDNPKLKQTKYAKRFKAE